MKDFSPMTSAGRQKHPKSRSTSVPDVTFIFADDVAEWDSYLSHQLEGTGASVHHEPVERMRFPLSCSRHPFFSEARVVLVILSPALVSFLDTRAADCFQFTRLLRPGKTIGMMCGASLAGIAAVKNVLVSYDDWRHLEAKDKDINMVRSVIEMIQETLAQSKENERINKPKFKLVPRKVQEGNGKVYVMLAKPLDSNVRLRITLEAKGAREVPIKKRNPYTLVFVIPDDLIHVQNMVNVHVWCGEDLLGVSSVKCASRLGELHSLLSAAPSPYEFLCSSLGVSSLHEADEQLVAAFRKNLPKVGFDLLQVFDQQEKDAIRCEFPTLLHFSARYGLIQLVRELMSCPGAHSAALLRNERGLTPAQIANHDGHNKVAELIEEIIMSGCKQAVEKVPSSHNFPQSDNKQSNPLDYYDIPAQPVPVTHLPANKILTNSFGDPDNDYMKMKGDHKENIEPCQSVFLEEHLDGMKNISNTERAKLSLLESQTKLIEIMEAYKKGASLTEVERMHNEWKIYYQVSDLEAKSTLDGLRNLYAKAQKAAKLSKKHSSSFSELRHFLNSKLRRKDSIDSKASMSRRSSKDSNCSEKIEPDALRPVSTLSVLSNTSSSSGSSFDRLSTVSAGSDSGHHSDFGEDRNTKFRERYDLRHQQQQRVGNGLHKHLQSLTLASKPPAPPPRAVKPVSRYGSLEDCKPEVPQYAVSKKWLPPSFEEALTMMDYSQPNSRSSTLNGKYRSERKMSCSSADFDVSCSDYDRPPPPRPSSSLAKLIAPASQFFDPKQDYDIVPPPLPLSPPPLKQDSDYDVPPSLLRSNSLSSKCSTSPAADYDFPKTILMDNTDTHPACTCQLATIKHCLSSVKSCCVANKLSSLKQSSPVLPSVPSFDLSVAREVEKQRNVANKVLQLPKSCGGTRDSIPEEMAPPPPVLENESTEEHYKIVGLPIPVPAAAFIK